jgi:AcrR family transcriptional regulator
LYVYIDSKLALYDAMYAQAYRELLAQVDGVPARGTPRQRLVRVSRVVVDFAVSDPPRQQLLFQRTIPGFEPSPASYALATEFVDRVRALLAATGANRPEQLDVFSALIAGLTSQQIANDPGGDRWTRHLEPVVACFLDHYGRRARR